MHTFFFVNSSKVWYIYIYINQRYKVSLNFPPSLSGSTWKRWILASKRLKWLWVAQFPDLGFHQYLFNYYHLTPCKEKLYVLVIATLYSVRSNNLIRTLQVSEGYMYHYFITDRRNLWFYHAYLPVWNETIINLSIIKMRQ